MACPSIYYDQPADFAQEPLIKHTVTRISMEADQ